MRRTLDTVCADVEVRNVPTSIEARVYDLLSDTRIEVDAIPRAGATPLDVNAKATVGPLTVDDDVIDPLAGRAVHAEVDVQALPRFLRFRALENAPRASIGSTSAPATSTTTPTPAPRHRRHRRRDDLRRPQLGRAPRPTLPARRSPARSTSRPRPGAWPTTTSWSTTRPPAAMTNFKQATLLTAPELTGGEGRHRQRRVVPHVDRHRGRRPERRQPDRRSRRPRRRHQG